MKYKNISFKYMTGIKLYTVLDYPVINKMYGRYEALRPIQAAKKAFIKLSKKFELTQNTIDTKFYLEFTILDKNTKQKYTYLGTKIRLHSPISVKENGKFKKYNFKNLVLRKPSKLQTIDLEKLFNYYDKQYNRYNRNR